MAELTISIDPEEFRGLLAVGELETAASGEDAPVESITKVLLHHALAARLTELGLPWNPPAQAVHERAAQASKPPGRPRALLTDPRARKYGLVAATFAVLVTLWGGYIQDWTWTGFQANDQLWDWLNLLLLPLVVATIPLWIERPDSISRGRRVTYLALAVAFTAFVIAGYLIPLRWTGFPGNTLWTWFELILLPVAVASIRLLPSVIRTLDPYHKPLFTSMAVVWVITVIGGYALSWTWTGYQGNTLWDWLQLLLLPLIVPTILVPTTLKWMSSGSRRAAARPATGSRWDGMDAAGGDGAAGQTGVRRGSPGR
ncbi:MAG: hypothetical protein ACLQDY_15760 [Streptosporangiaceae bacterium]